MALLRLAAAALALVLLPLVPLPGAEAQAQSPPPPPPDGSVWTVYNRVQCDVFDNYAVVRVVAEIGNRGPDPEFPFIVKVPDEAMVTGMTIQRDGTTFTASIAPREAAREAYEEHKAAQMTGGLVERERGSQTYQFLVNVAEFESVVATLTYEVYLAADAGAHALHLEAPVSGFGQDLGAAFDCVVAHRDGVTDLWAGEAGPAVERIDATSWRLSHAVGPRAGDAATPLDLHYSLAPTPDAGSLVAAVHNGTGYFAHRFQAPPDEEQIPLDLVAVLDVSGSMSGLKLQQMQDAALQLVRSLDPEDRLSIVFFSDTARPAWEGLQPATDDVQAEAAQAIARSFAAGGTGIDAALAEGLEQLGEPAEGRMPVLVFLTDGQPTVGAVDPAAIRASAAEGNVAEARVFSLAFGADADWGLVAGLARDAEGLGLHVPEGDGAEVDLARFMTAVATPVLRDVEVEYPEGVAAFATSAPVLFQGSELLVVGTFGDGRESIGGEVRGQTADGARTYRFDERVQLSEEERLARLVAFEQIRHLEAEVAAEGETPERIDAIIDVAMRFGFVTDYTSLVLTLEKTSGEPLMWREDCANCSGLVAQESSWATATGAPMAPAGGGRLFAVSHADRDSDGADDGLARLGHASPQGDGEEEDSRKAKPAPGLGPLAGVGAIAAAVALAVALRRRA